VVTANSAKFNGYVSGFKRKLYGNIARGIWNLITAVIIPLAVAYWTIKLTLPVGD